MSNRRSLVVFLGPLVVLLCREPASAASIKVPAGSNLSVSEREDPSMIEHMPLQNLITWEVFIRNGVCSGSGACLGGTSNGQACSSDTDCPALPLTVTGGTAQFYDEKGSAIVDPVLGSLAVTPALVEQVATESSGPAIVVGPDGAVLGEHANVVLPFPFEKVSHNFVPASVDLTLCFKEFEGPGGTCVDPLEVKGVKLVEYRVPAGQTYIFPLKNPSIFPSGILFTSSGGGHEIGDNHRLARNQRYAYDVGVLVGGVDCTDGCDANPDYFIYTEPVYAVADAVVAVAEKGHPENPAPGVVLPGAGQCPSQRCDGLSAPCDPGEYDGSGNQIVLIHGNSEFTTMAHMTTGSNDFLSCNDAVLQGSQIGNVGNVGTSGAPHLHYSSLNTPSPEDSGAQSFPMYLNNIQYATAGYGPKRQLDVAMFSGTQWTVLPPPTPLPRNATVPNAIEAEPNDTLASHNAVDLPVTLAGTAEAADSGDMAVRGDGVEDVFRIDLATRRFGCGFDLSTACPRPEPRPVRPHAGPAGAERDAAGKAARTRTRGGVCPGARRRGPTTPREQRRPTKSARRAVLAERESDPQTIACAVTNAVRRRSPWTTGCQATCEFKITIHDNCCLDLEPLELKVTASNPTTNATLGPVQLDTPTVALGPRDVEP